MCEKLSKSSPFGKKDRQMEMEQKAVEGEKGVDGGALCFEPIDGAKDHEILEPIWSELDVFGSGTLNGLLSSDVHDGGDGADVDDRELGHIPGTGPFDLLKVKEEFAQHGCPETAHTQIDAHAASLGGVVNIHDYFTIRDMPRNNTEAPYGSHGNLVFHGDSFQMKEELLSEELENASVGLDNANSNAECRLQRQEQYISETNQTEESVSHEEELKLRLVGVDTVNNSSELTVNAYELHVPQLPGEENKEVSRGMEREMLVVAKPETNKIVANQVGETRADANAESNGNLVEQGDDQVHSDAGVSEVDKVNSVMHEADQEESDVPGSELDDEEINYEYTMADIQQPKSSPSFISEMLRDGSLSAEGLASKGFVFVDDNESDSGEDSADSSDDEEDEESDVVSSADSEEDVKEIKSRVKTKKKEDAEETGPPRTKHELDVLPLVPKVTAVLEPHHTPVSVGHISSVLDLTVIVESSGSERILNENSILWLTEPRIPLGIVDEVFGPVKNPFYLVRFNDLSEIPEDAKTGADVSYVSEFSEFVLKDNPSLYRKAVDASGLDDEELASDEDLEFSDDEKEAAARMREKSKRALDNRGENRQGSQDWKSAADGQHSKGQRTERGRGRGRSGGRGAAATENAVDSAADFVAGMDLHGSPWHPTQRSGGKQQQSGRRWNNRGRQSSSPRNSASHQEMQTRGVRTGPVDGQMSSIQQQQESPQRRDGPYFAEQQANSQMHSQQVLRQAGGMQGIPFNAGAAIPAHHLQGHRRDAGLYFAEQANSSQMHSQQVQRQVGGSMQGIPFNAGALPAHLQGQGIVPGQQQPTTGFQAYGYHHQVPVYDAQFGIPRQGNIYSSVPGGPQLMQNSMVFGNPNLPPNPYFNNLGQGGQMSMINSQAYGNLVHAGQLNFGVPVHQRSLGDATQPGVHPPLTSLMAPSSLLASSGAVARDHRAPRSVPQNNQNQGGPVGGARASRHNGQRGHSSGRQRKGYPHNKDSRG